MMDVVTGATAGLQTVLKVVQRFKCAGGTISELSYDTERVYGTKRDTLAGIPGLHPLVSLHSAQQTKGAAMMSVSMDFVDVTEAWLEFIRTSSKEGAHDRAIWEASPHFETGFCVLACLNGFPKLWFASIPKACDTANGVSALAFFRPAGYSYDAPGDDFGSIFNRDHVKAQFGKSSHHDWFVKKYDGVPDDQSGDRGARHQFAMFGGEDASTGKTFFRQFLDDSDF